MAVEFSVGAEAIDDTTHLVVAAGEVDLFTAPEFKATISEPIDAGATRVVVDLTDVSFIDSSSLGVLIGAHKRLRLRDGSLVIVCHDRSIVNTFKITGLDGVFEIVASRADALTT